MKLYRTVAPKLFWCCAVLSALLLCGGNSFAASSQPSPWLTRPSKDAVARRGFDHFYNLEYDKAIHDFEQLQKDRPDDPFVTNYLATAIMWKELYRVGALDSESYANDNFLDQKAKRPIDPAVRQRVLDLITRSIALSEQRIKTNPGDADAYYARGTARGLRCTYMGMGEKAWLAAVRAGLGAREDHEKVLQLNPGYTDAKTVVGVHNYIIGSLNFAAKALVAIIGVGGNRQKGLNYLREAAANPDGLSAMDAKIALALFLRREQKYKEALDVVKTMVDTCPRNFLVAIEFGHLLNASGQGPDAIAYYRQILTKQKQGGYSLSEPEMAAYGLGISLRGQRRFAEAAEAFDMVRTYPEAEKDLVARANLAAGEMYDTVQKRDFAMKKYQEVIASNADGPSVSLARKHIKQAYRYE